MLDLSCLFTAGLVLSTLPIATGILITYSVIAPVLGPLIGISKNIPNDIGIVTTGSGIFLGTLLIAAA